jgi:DNA-binding transcriptional MerR regulator
MNHYLRTSDLAKAVGVHPNTVRLYEQWGFLPEAGRSPSGYRRFTEYHLDQLRLIRLIFSGGWPGRSIRKLGLGIIEHSAAGDLGGALEMAHQLVLQVQSELAQAESAGTPVDATTKSLHIGEVADLLNTTIDAIRNWERNHLIAVPRDPANGYRLYGASEIGRLRVIRMLLRAGYSMMAILRMVSQIDRGDTRNLRQALDTPLPGDDVFMVNDHWLSALEEFQGRALQVVALLEEMLGKHYDLPIEFAR